MQQQLYTAVNVPLPSKPLVISEEDSHYAVCQKIDRFFDDLIRNYPESTQDLLRAMYYDEANVLDVEKAIEQSYQANWFQYADETGIHYEMEIDCRLHASPIMCRWNKIHEVACHIGQTDQRIAQVGLDRWQKEFNSFQRFTELSIAPAEKMLLDALPWNIIKEDLAYMNDASVASIVKNDIRTRKKMPYDEYVKLQHRISDPIDSIVAYAEHITLHLRQDVSVFNKLMSPVTPSSTTTKLIVVTGNDLTL